MGEIIENPWLASGIVFIAQSIFLYLRTLNVIYTSDRKVTLAILTGMGIGVSWLVSTSIGIKSVLDFQIGPIIGYLFGGVLGMWYGFKTDKKIRTLKRKI